MNAKTWAIGMTLVACSLAGANLMQKSLISELEETTIGQATMLKDSLRREEALWKVIVKQFDDRRDSPMYDAMLKNGKPFCTLIQSFAGPVTIVYPIAVGGGKQTFQKLHEAQDFVDSKGWVIGVTHPTLRKEAEDGHSERKT